MSVQPFRPRWATQDNTAYYLDALYVLDSREIITPEPMQTFKKQWATDADCATKVRGLWLPDKSKP